MFSARETRRRTKRGLGEETSLLLIAAGVVVAGLAAGAALVIGSWWAGESVTGNPVAALLELAAGRRRWPWQATIVLAAIATVMVTGSVRVWRWLRTGSELDAAARTMQRPADIRIGRVEDNAAAAVRLLQDAAPEVRELPGPPLGVTVTAGVSLHVPAELGVTIAAGTRTGKTMAWAIPAVLSAWGPCLATSNKPDLYRHTVYGRARRGRGGGRGPPAGRR
ncbi:hypothetical protein [Nocardia carnea]|uniref:hypothetical protein n=1 Tax=Nocardia carnea TaxID=37328 RepID=UPI002454D6A7|nr:hypothetical protein [Nocardia carnea]